MLNSFADELWLFAKTVDLVDSKICDKARDSVDHYIVESLGMKCWEVQTDGPRTPLGPGLATFETHGGKEWTNGEMTTTPIQKEDGSFTGQSTFAYAKGIPLWITEQNEGVLTPQCNCIDEWSGTDPVPSYWSYFPANLKTSIIVPLRDGDKKCFGFLNMESETCRHNSPTFAHEIERLADGIAAIIRSHEGHRDHHRNTEDAFKIVDDKLRKCVPPGTRPQLFVASPSAKECEEVLGEVEAVLAEFAEDIEVKYWKDADDSGEITGHIAEAIAGSRFAICYFSEPDDAPKFKDNPNVLIEAGMIHSLSNDVTAEPVAWIPIREKNSPPMPFDIASQRTVLVPRTFSKDEEVRNGMPYGKLNADKFRSELRKRVKKLLSG